MSRGSSSIHVVIAVVIVLLCIGTGVYSFLSLRAADDETELNLYSLVPDDATAVIETDRMAELVNDVDNLHCSRDGYYLYFSDLFVYTKNYLYAWTNDAPHGLSPQMNKVLLSFHGPDNPENQVMYCSLGSGDIEMMKQFIRKYASGKYPPKSIDYKGETIHIYPVPDGRFLSAFYSSEFIAVSFRKPLIEKVIDTYRSGRSLIDDATFQLMHEGRRPGVSATVYTRIRAIDMGPSTDERLSPVLSLGEWSEFDLRFDGDGIYCSGVSHQSDSLSAFFRQLGCRQPLIGLPGERLPSSTFFHVHSPVLDSATLSYFVPVVPLAGDSTVGSGSPLWRLRRPGEEGPALSSELVEFITDEGEGEMLTCLFLSSDEADVRPCAVLSLTVADGVRAERRLQAMEREAKTAATPFLPWRMHRGRLLLAPDERSLQAYVKAIEGGDVLEDVPAYQAGTSPLSSSYGFLMMADLSRLTRPEWQGCVKAIPGFFLRQARFFRHFYLSAQFTSGDGTVYPNLTLMYNE